MACVVAHITSLLYALAAVISICTALGMVSPNRSKGFSTPARVYVFLVTATLFCVAAIGVVAWSDQVDASCAEGSK